MSDPCPFGDEDGERGTGVGPGGLKFTQPLRDLGIGRRLSRLPAFYFRYNAWRYVDVAPVLRPVERVAFGVGEPRGLAHFPDRTLGTGTDVTRPAHGVSCSRYGFGAVLSVSITARSARSAGESYSGP